MTSPRVVRAPRGAVRSCKGWIQEAALRMLMNNLDPEVAERPQDLVVYGGTGKAARDWPAFDAICRTLLTLADDETLLVQSGKPVGVFTTHPDAPRVLIANANLVGRWATWDVFRSEYPKVVGDDVEIACYSFQERLARSDPAGASSEQPQGAQARRPCRASSA